MRVVFRQRPFIIDLPPPVVNTEGVDEVLFLGEKLLAPAKILAFGFFSPVSLQLAKFL